MPPPSQQQSTTVTLSDHSSGFEFSNSGKDSTGKPIKQAGGKKSLPLRTERKEENKQVSLEVSEMLNSILVSLALLQVFKKISWLIKTTGQSTVP